MLRKLPAGTQSGDYSPEFYNCKSDIFAITILLTSHLCLNFLFISQTQISVCAHLKIQIVFFSIFESSFYIRIYCKYQLPVYLLVFSFKFVYSDCQDNFNVPLTERWGHRGPRPWTQLSFSLERMRLYFSTVKCANPIGNY